MCDELFGQEADLVDWRHFLVCVSQPWPLPLSHQLLETLARFRELADRDQRVSRQRFMSVKMWVDDGEREEAEMSGFNRNKKLKKFFFELFSEENKVDYTNMVGCVCALSSKRCVLLQLLYMCVDGTADLGLAKALCTVTGEEISLNEVGNAVRVRKTNTHTHAHTLTHSMMRVI